MESNQRWKVCSWKSQSPNRLRLCIPNMIDLLTRLGRLYIRHLALMMLPFQAILNDFGLESVKTRKFRYHYLFHFTVIGLIVVDSCIQYYLHGLCLNDPVFFHNLIITFLPPIFTKHSHSLFGVIYAFILLCHGLAFFDYFAHLDFILLLSPEESGLRLRRPFRKGILSFVARELCSKLIKKYASDENRAKRLTSFMAFQGTIAFFIPLCFLQAYKILSSNWQYFGSFRVICCIFVCPIFIQSAVTSIHIGLKFLGQNNITQIRQQYYLSRIFKQRQFIVNPGNVQKHFHRCQRTMLQLLDITREIEACNRFYSKYVTVQIVLYGMAGCSVAHVVVQKASEIPIFAIIPWIVWGCWYLSLIILYNAFSSRTINLNKKLFAALRQLQLRLLSGGYLNRWQIVKLDLVNEYKLLLHKCSFRLANSAPINNKLFVFQIFGCVSFFYMKLVREESLS